jgi:uncharacterized glyoxalase superfamily protein PhnB
MEDKTMEPINTSRPNGHNDVNQFIIIKGGADKFIEFCNNVFNAEERKEVRTPDKDGTLIHAEVKIGNSTIMIADSKKDWPFTPGFVQIYVKSINEILNKAGMNGGEIVTEKTKFYGGYNIARIKDPFGNMWWLYEHSIEENKDYDQSDKSWHERKPSYIYTTLMEAMSKLGKDK